MNKLVSIETDVVFWNGQRYLYHQCEAQNFIRHPHNTVEYVRCGREAAYLVTQIGGLTGRQFNLHICEEHVEKYREETNETTSTGTGII